MTVELKMWSNETEFVIAPTRERAAELAREAVVKRGENPDPEEFAPEFFDELTPDKSFTLTHDDTHRVTKTVAEWIAERGEGWLATTEF